MRRICLVLVLVACAKAGNNSDPDSGMQKPPDAAIDGNGCSVQPCSILPQCGCTGLSACDIDLDDLMGTKCRTINSPGTETSTCSAQVDCDKGFVCLGTGSSRACKKYCEMDSECGTPRAKCILVITSGGQPIPDIPKACSSNCDPASTNPAECPSTFKCNMYVAMSGTMTVPISDCAAAGAGAQGADCKVGTTGDESRCAKGYSCTTTDGGTNFRCRRVCTNPGSTSSSQCGGQACIMFQTPFTLAGVTYGVCAP